jgi:sugar phosphate isomerase/epimerase
MRSDQLAVQLYTVRHFLQSARDVAVSLKKLQDIGYTAIESFPLNISVEELALILRDSGLKCCGTHELPHRILAQPEAVAERLDQLNCRNVIYPSPVGIDIMDPKQLRELTHGLNEAGAALLQRGKTLSYHNHAVEFVRVDRKPILQTIFEQTSASNVHAEIDTYWVQLGGGDPADWCRRLKDRLRLIHLKDYAFTPENEPAMAEIGQGNLDWHKIIKAADDAGCEWFVVEHDEPSGDPFMSLRKSFTWIQENILS